MTTNPDEPDLNQLANNSLFAGIGDPRKRAFLAAYVVVGRIGEASEVAGLSRRNHLFWMAQDAEYRRVFHQSRDRIADHVEGSLVERLIHGWDEPIYQGGELVGHRRKFDNATALRFLGKLNPDKFGDKIESTDRSMAPVNLTDLRDRLNRQLPVTDQEAQTANVLSAMRSLSGGSEVSDGEVAVANTLVSMAETMRPSENVRVSDQEAALANDMLAMDESVNGSARERTGD